MIASLPNSTNTKGFISELSVLKYKLGDLNLTSYRLPRQLDREVGRKISYRLSRYFPETIVIWDEQIFYILARQGRVIASGEDWNSAFKSILVDLGLENSWGNLQLNKTTEPKVEAIALLAQEIINVERPFTSMEIYKDKNAKVIRQASISYEVIELNDYQHPAINITSTSPIISTETLDIFIKTHPYRQDLQKLLIDLEVQTLDTNSTAKIVEIVGPIAEHRESLIAKATGAISRQALASAPDDQPVVAVTFGKRRDKFHYPLGALCPLIVAKTAEQLGLDWGKLLKATKIGYEERQKLLVEYKSKASKVLACYGFELTKSINSLTNDNRDLFWNPSTPIEQTQLLFGQNKIYPYNSIFKGLTEGGIYRRSKQFSSEVPIRIAILDLVQSNLSSDRFILEVKRQLNRFWCKFIILNPDGAKIHIENLDRPSGRAELDEKIEELLIIPPDLVFIFLPQTDRDRDEENGGSLYHRIYGKLLKRGIATQFIYEKTLLEVDAKYVLNQVMSGIFAKLGHIPFVLAQPLDIADVFIGLDVGRRTKRKLTGSMNACAGVSFYGKQGEFLRAKSEDTIVEGEEIPQQFLEKLLPAGELKGKTVLIYRDGRFCGDEARYLVEWAQAIKAKFILVECCKSGCPRLYNLASSNIRQIQAPDRGLALKLSDREAILVTTQVAIKIGVPRPIRLKIRPEGHQVSIDQVLETTLKFTLLNYGALKSLRLPVMLDGADKIARLRLQGVYVPEFKSQSWL